MTGSQVIPHLAFRIKMPSLDNLCMEDMVDSNKMIQIMIDSIKASSQEAMVCNRMYIVLHMAVDNTSMRVMVTGMAITMDIKIITTEVESQGNQLPHHKTGPEPDQPSCTLTTMSTRTATVGRIFAGCWRDSQSS